MVRMEKIQKSVVRSPGCFPNTIKKNKIRDHNTTDKTHMMKILKIVGFQRISTNANPNAQKTSSRAWGYKTKFLVTPGIKIQGNNCIIPRKIKVAPKQMRITCSRWVRLKSSILSSISSSDYQITWKRSSWFFRQECIIYSGADTWGRQIIFHFLFLFAWHYPFYIVRWCLKKNLRLTLDED